MSEQHDEKHRERSHSSFDEVLPDIPEIPNHEGLGDADLSNSSQQLSSENVARWNEQGRDQNSGLEQKSQTKSRRKAPPAPDHVKHRRTRSGCYTCRSRRVKVRMRNSLTRAMTKLIAVRRSPSNLRAYVFGYPIVKLGY